MSIVDVCVTERVDLATTGEPKAEFIAIDRWQEFVESRPESLPFHHERWINLLHEQYGFPVFIPAIIRRGEVVAGLPFMLTKTLWGRRKLIALPFTDRMPILAVDDAAAQALREAFANLFTPTCKTVYQRDDSTVPVAGEFGWYRHEIDTRGGYSAIAERFAEGLRRNVRKAQRLGLACELRKDIAALNIFYRLHANTRRRLGVPVQPRRFFEGIHRHLLDNGLGFIGVVSRDSNPMAAAVFLSFHGTLIYKYGASEEHALEFRPNEFLMDCVLQMAAQDETRNLDLGITPVNQEGLLRYKRKWGGAEIPVGYASFAGMVDQSSDPSRLLALAAPVIRRAPSMFCRLLGDMLYKYSA
jgi:hypothetical protein